MAYLYFLHYTEDHSIKSHLPQSFRRDGLGRYIRRNSVEGLQNWLEDNQLEPPYFCLYFIDIRNGCPQGLEPWLKTLKKKDNEAVLFRVNDGQTPPVTEAYGGSLALEFPDQSRYFRALLLGMIRKPGDASKYIEKVFEPLVYRDLAPFDQKNLRIKYDGSNRFLRHHISTAHVPRNIASGQWEEPVERKVFLEFTRCMEGMILALEDPSLEERGKAEARVLQNLWHDYQEEIIAQKTEAVDNLDRDIESFCELNKCEEKVLFHLDHNLQVDSAKYSSSLETLTERLLHYNSDLPRLQSTNILYLPYGKWQAFIEEVRETVQKVTLVWIMVHLTDIKQGGGEEDRLQELVEVIKKGNGQWPKLLVYESDASQQTIKERRQEMSEKYPHTAIEVSSLMSDVKGENPFFCRDGVWDR